MGLIVLKVFLEKFEVSEEYLEGKKKDTFSFAGYYVGGYEEKYEEKVKRERLAKEKGDVELAMKELAKEEADVRLVGSMPTRGVAGYHPYRRGVVLGPIGYIEGFHATLGELERLLACLHGPLTQSFLCCHPHSW